MSYPNFGKVGTAAVSVCLAGLIGGIVLVGCGEDDAISNNPTSSQNGWIETQSPSGVNYECFITTFNIDREAEMECFKKP